MTRLLQKHGNSKALILNRTMLEHLGTNEAVEVSLEEGRIVITRHEGPVPQRQSFSEAKSSTFAQYDIALQRLADAR